VIIIAKKKVTIDKGIEEIKKLVNNKNLIIGTNTTIDSLKKGKLLKAYLSLNCPEDVKAEIQRYSEMNNVEVINLNINNHDLSAFLKRKHPISVFGIIK
jgi:ribosomal protein L30E